MSADGAAKRLWYAITQHHLDARYPDLDDIRRMLEEGLIADDLAQGLLLQIEPYVQEDIDHPRPLHRPPTQDKLDEDGPPDITVGELVDAPGVRFGIRYSDRPRNILISGNAGSGKTTLMRGIVRKVDELGNADPSRRVSQIILDKLRDYTDLPNELEPHWLHLDIDNPGTRISLAAPVGVPPNVWINLVASMFTALSGMCAAWTCFANMLRWLVGVLNPVGCVLVRWPSLRLLLDVANAAPLTLWAAKPDYERTLIGVLEGAVHAADVLDCFSGLDLARDVVEPGRSLELEMPSVSPPWLRQFIIGLLLSQLLYGAIHRREKVDRTRVLLIMDESDQDATYEADQRFPDKMSPLATLMRMGRQYGIMSVTGFGRLGDASAYVQSESQYHFIFSQSDERSIVAARRTLLLPAEANAIFPALIPGHCIARRAQGSWTQPAELKVDYVAPARDVTVPKFDTPPFLPGRRLKDVPEIQSGLQELVDERRDSRLPKPTPKQKKLSANAHRLLHAIATIAWAPAATLWKRSGKVPSQAVQQAVRKELLDRGLADSDEPRLGSANVLLYLLTVLGSDFLGRRHVEAGSGTIVHRHVSHWIAMCGEAESRTSHVEFQLPETSHRVDAAHEVSRECFDVFEVVVTATTNLSSHLAALWPCRVVRNVTIVCLQKRQLAALRTELLSDSTAQAFGDRLRWEVAETYLRRCFP